MCVITTVEKDSWERGVEAEEDLAGAGRHGGSVRGSGSWVGWRPHHFVLVQHQPIVVGHEAKAVPPLLVVLLVLKEVSREDDALVQGHL